MTSLSIVLFILGMAFLVLGWRWQSPQDADLLTALKGLVHLKREVESIQDNLRALESKVEHIEHIPENAQDASGTLQEIVSAVLQATQVDGPGRKGMEAEKTPRAEPEPQALPEKYLRVLKLAESGFSPKEIARELSLSQDAVGLVLRTGLRGGKA